MSKPKQPDSAPESIIYCPHCATMMVTQTIGDKPRRVCPSCKFIFFTDPKVGVGVLVIEEEKVLLVKRGMNPEKGKWSIPAGFLDYGEDPQITAAREVKEETNLQINITGLLDIYFNSEALAQGGASIFILYRAEVVAGDLRAGDDAEEASFFGRDELPELAFTSTQDALDRWHSNG
jgi:ADP-ribose pyrophosphatase YjhB (NUDIX family)